MHNGIHNFFCLSGVPLFSDAIKGPLYVIHTCTVTSTWHPVVVYRYPWGKWLTMQLRWEIKLVLFFMLKESCGPEVMDNLTKVMRPGLGCELQALTLTHLQEFSWKTCRLLFSESQLNKSEFLNWENRPCFCFWWLCFVVLFFFFSLLLCYILRCAGCNRLPLLNQVSCGPFLERKTNSQWLELLRIVKSCNGDYCAQSKGSRQLSPNSALKLPAIFH